MPDAGCCNRVSAHLSQQQVLLQLQGPLTSLHASSGVSQSPTRSTASLLVMNSHTPIKKRRAHKSNTAQHSIEHSMTQQRTLLPAQIAGLVLIIRMFNPIAHYRHVMSIVYTTNSTRRAKTGAAGCDRKPVTFSAMQRDGAAL